MPALVRRTPRRALIAALGVALLGCGAEGDGRDRAEPSSTDPEQAGAPLTGCQREVIELRSWLRDLRADGFDPGEVAPDDIRLVRVEGGDPASIAGASGVRADGEVTSAMDAPNVGGVPRLAIDERAPWSSVVSSIDRARGPHRRVRLLFHKQPRAAVPPFSLLDHDVANVRGFPPAERPKRVANYQWERRVYAECKPARDSFANLQVHHRASLERVIEQLPSLIEACSCRVDLVAARVHVAGLTGRLGAPVLVSLPLMLATGSESTKAAIVRAPADAPWAQVYGAFAASNWNETSPVTLLLEPVSPP